MCVHTANNHTHPVSLLKSLGLELLETEKVSFYKDADGEIIHNYRRISRGWKEYSKTDEHYAALAKSIGYEKYGVAYIFE